MNNTDKFMERTHGDWLRPARRLALALICAGALLAAFRDSPASAATFSETFCRVGAAAGQCSGPSGIAVDQTGGPGGAGGTVYLIDRNNSRVDVFDPAGHFLMAFGLGVRNGVRELQTCTTVCGRGAETGSFQPTAAAVDQSSHLLYLAESGSVEELAFNSSSKEFEFLRSFGGGVLDGGASGTGNLSAGSTEVTNLVTTSRRFTVGQTVTGPGILAGTRIVKTDFGEGFVVDGLTLSNAATASGTGVSLAAPTPPANNPNDEIQTVSLGGSPSGGVFTLDQSGGNVTANTSAGSSTVASVAGVIITRELTAGSNEIFLDKFGSTFGFRVGQTIGGAGIPAGTTITAVKGNLTLSAPATASGVVGISTTAHGTGTLASGSSVITNVTNVGEFVQGQTIAGAGIPAGTQVTNVNEAESKLSLSDTATASGANVALTATVRPLLYPGLTVSGPGVPSGTTIVSIAANGNLTLSAGATASQANADFGIGIPFDASAATLQALLEPLPEIGSGNVTVSGPAGGPWNVDFKGRYADTNVAQLGSNAAGLTPSGEVAVETAVEGASAFETCTKAEIAEGYLCLPGIAGHGEGRLDGGRAPVAVAPATHRLWVGGSDRIEQFGEDGEYLSEVKLPGAGEIVALAVDSAGNFYVRSGTRGQSQIENDVPGVRKYDSAGNPVAGWGEGGIVDAAGYAATLALDPASGDLYVGDCPQGAQGGGSCPGYTLLRFDSSGKETEAWGGGEVIGDPYGNALAFDPLVHRLYVSSSAGEKSSAAQIFSLPPAGPLIENESTKASSVRKTTATLEAQVSPEGKPTTYRFQYITQGQYEEDGEEFGAGTQQTPLSASLGEDFAFHKVSNPLTGLLPATAYRFRVLAFNSNGPVAGTIGGIATFETLPPAAVDASAAQVTASSATLLAQINPLGDATSYHFEYLSREALERNEEGGEPPFTGASRAPAVDASVGAGEEAVSVSQHLQGLQTHTAYRYRVVVTNAVAPQGLASPTLGFTTQALAAAALPDSRQWELASPPDKHGALLEPIGSQAAVQAAASGDAATYVSSAPTEAEPQGNVQGAQVLSARGPAAWASRDLAGPHRQAIGLSIGQGSEYRLFSADLSLGILQPFGPFEPNLSPQATEQTPLLGAYFPPAEPTAFCAESCYQPLVSAANVPAGTKFGEEGKCPGVDGRIICGPTFVSATTDLAHIVLYSGVGLTAYPGDKGGLYEWSDGQLQLVSVLPGGSPVEPAVVPTLGFGYVDRIARGAISEDGSRVFFSENGGNHHLYLRDVAKGETLQLDAIQGGSGSESPHPVFQLASADGSLAYFTDPQALTPDSGASGAAPDLYECRIEEVAGHLSCALTDLTPAIGGESGAALGLMPGASADGSYAYFVANGVFAPGAKPGDCHLLPGTSKLGGACNLYLRHAGVTTFIASLSGDDFPDWSGNQHELGSLTARVSPDGRWLAFMSDRPLTGYDSRDAVSGERDEEVFLYHATGPGQLVCVSCNPTGARPHGIEYGDVGNPHMPLAGDSRIWASDQFIAANVPAWSNDLYQSRYLSDSGRLFFNARDALVPQDTNGTEDVYQYEPPQGEGAPPSDSCSESDPTYNPDAQGCVSLISSGFSPEESAFLDASETGSDVFFLTNSRLSSLDTDGARDVYDAHACTAESPCPPPPPPPSPNCEGDACQLPAEPPNDPTPGSLTYQGPGNEQAAPPPARKTCPKGSKKVKSRGRVVCRKQKHHKRSHRRAARHERGGNR